MALFEKEIEALHKRLEDLGDLRKEHSMTAEQASVEAEGIGEWLAENKRVAKLTELIPKAKKAEGELAYITKGQYRNYWGREPKAVILTKDGKRVRWEYALDELAQELGLERKYGSDASEALRDLITLADEYKERKADLIHGLDIAKDDIEKAEGKMELVTLHIGRREQVVDTQDERSEHAKAIDDAIQAKSVLVFPNVNKWLKDPGRHDIRGVDTSRSRVKSKPTAPRVSGVR